MKFTTTILLFLFGMIQTSNGQDLNLLQLTEQELPNGDIAVYATNLGYSPLTATVEFSTLTNMTVDKELPYVVAIPAKAKEYLVMKIQEAKVIRGNSMEYRYGFNYILGDAINAKHDDDHVYLLPFPAGTSFTIGQGYNGRFSHGGFNCLDFNMEVGSPVCAARGGVVAKVKQNSNYGCQSTKCKGHANYIMIVHDDGTMARYIHLKLNGSKVREGDKVNAGDIIGYSGNTGWSSGPHLHFEVDQPTPTKTLTIPTKFKLPDGKPRYLKEGQRYTAVH